jgi:hypothetical protein
MYPTPAASMDWEINSSTTIKTFRGGRLELILGADGEPRLRLTDSRVIRQPARRPSGLSRLRYRVGTYATFARPYVAAVGRRPAQPAVSGPAT